ncbi:transposase [Hymenobacter sp. GOD-10R]|uniref:transposase n=1 Tax=Hymenobacter sp. GOD-10R TaxID=3093922 RepID=UPI002D7A00DF|nr:transposase [Hymenobacter sp. GOD-10R]WRQ31982.1 transposase [Hymenobacter sp. GOD-10R]
MTQKLNIGSPRKRHRYDIVFRAEVLRLASESRSTQAAARQLGISPKLLYKRQKATQPVLEVGIEESESVAMRQLRAEVRHLQQERDILKKALAIFTQPTP